MSENIGTVERSLDMSNSCTIIRISSLFYELILSERALLELSIAMIDDYHIKIHMNALNIFIYDDVSYIRICINIYIYIDLC